jgi:hypothetical protein
VDPFSYCYGPLESIHVKICGPPRGSKHKLSQFWPLQCPNACLRARRRRSFKREGLAGGGSQTRAGEDRALDEARQLARSQNWARKERSMSGNYARDRCFCSKNTRPLCETCAWFAKDTHPTLSPFGASVGDRCGSQNRYWHSLLENRCLTPGRDADATGSRTIRRWGRVGSSEGGAAALEQSDYTSTAAHTDRGSRSRSRVAPTMTPAPTPTPSPSTRARSPTTAALELRATKVRRCAESVDRFSPARTGFRAGGGGTRYCDASSKQSDFFFSEASRAIAPHAARWRRDALFLSLGDHLGRRR